MTALAEDLDLQLKRLDVESGDVLVLKTARKLTAERADGYRDALIALCAAEGVHRVSVIVLDDCTDLTIERPATRMVQQRRDVPQSMGG